MDFAYPFAVLGTGLVILIYVWTGLTVGKARKAHGVDYPNTVGNDAFNRVWRAHQNTLEALPQFIPSLWMFAVIISDLWAGCCRWQLNIRCRLSTPLITFVRPTSPCRQCVQPS